MRKTLTIALVALMLLMLLSNVAIAEEKIKLQFMGWEASVYETEANLAAIAKFEAANPEYEVEFIRGKQEDHHTRLMTMMAGNAAPDVFYMDPKFSHSFIELGLLMDIGDIFEKEFRGVELIDWSYQKMTSPEGVFYGIDSCIVGNILLVNPSMFEAVGIEAPSPEEALTWDELIDLAKKLTLRDENGIVSQYGVFGFENEVVWECYCYYNDVELFNEDGEFEIKDREKCIEIMEKLKGLRTEHGVAPGAAFIENSGMSPNQLLQTGKVAMVFQGSFSIQELSKMGFRFIGVKPPVLDEEHPVGILHQSYNCAIWSGSKYPDAAKTLAAYLTSEESQLVFVRDGLWMSNRKYLYQPENYDIWLSHEVYPEGFEALIPLFENGNFRTTGTIRHANEVVDTLTEEFQNFLYQDQPADVTIDNMTIRVNEILIR